MPPTRRAYLTTLGTAAAVGLAGCTGSSGAAETSHSCELTDRESVSELPRPTRGNDEATVTVDIFEDFACPGCARFALEDFGRLVDEYPDEDVRFRRFDFLVVDSNWNEPVANAARSIQDELGEDAFFEFADAAYESQSDYSWQVIGDLAEEVDADPCRVLSDADGSTYDGVIQADQTEGENRGVPGTPAAVVDGQLLEGAASYENVSSAIDDAL
jgi:protein-disulfide isomerase